jgi:hypothetical protein
MRENGIQDLIHGASNVLNCKSLERSGVGIRVHANILQGSLKCGETLAFQEGADCGGAVRGTVDVVLCPDFLQVLDQLDPLLRGSFLKYPHKLLVSSRPGWPVQDFNSKLMNFDCPGPLFGGLQDIREQGQHRLERQRLKLSPKMGKVGFLEGNLISSQ